jgi:hypothetical protein
LYFIPQAAAESLAEKLQKKHEIEKLRAFQDFDDYKTKSNEKFQKMNNEYLSKYNSQDESINKMNSNFSEKLLLFEKTVKDLNKKIQNSNSAGTAGLDEQKLKFEKMIEDLENSNTEKYTNMLKEQTKLQG